MKLNQISKAVGGVSAVWISLRYVDGVQAVFNIGDKFGSQTVLGGSISKISTLSQLFNPVIFSLYTLGGVVTFFALMYGGFSYIMGAGQADQKRIEQGKQVITWSLVGLAVLISSFWILQIIEKVTGAKIIESNL